VVKNRELGRLRVRDVFKKRQTLVEKRESKKR